MIAAFGIGNGVQSNSVAQVLSDEFAISKMSIGLVIALLVTLVILGGIKSIGKTASKLVPTMAIIYIVGGLFIVISNITMVPEIFMLIINSAFSSTAASGGFAGASVWMAIRFGVSRGIFSNEAGLGSSCLLYTSPSQRD